MIRTSILSGIAFILKMVGGFFTNKIVAVYVGPSGLTLIAQFQSFVVLAVNFSGNVFSTAITKYTAEYYSDSEKRNSLWSAASKIAFVVTGIAAISVFTFSKNLSFFVFHSYEFSYFFKILSIVIPFFIFNTFVLSILNGHKNINKYIRLNVLFSTISLLIAFMLTSYWQFEGAVMSFLIVQPAFSIFIIKYVKNERWFKLKNFTYNITTLEFRKLMSFSLITLTTVGLSNLTLIYLRNYLSTKYSIDTAGCWQAIWFLSQTTLTFVTTSLATYLLPTISTLEQKELISEELKKGFLIVVPLSLLILLVTCNIKEVVIVTLFSEKFMPMGDLFLWQFTGNIIKASAWLFGYTFVARAMVKAVILTEILFSILFVLLVHVLTNRYGFVGMAQAYALNSLLHLFCMTFVYYKYVGK